MKIDDYSFSFLNNPERTPGSSVFGMYSERAIFVLIIKQTGFGREGYNRRNRKQYSERESGLRTKIEKPSPCESVEGAFLENYTFRPVYGSESDRVCTCAPDAFTRG